jgi:putative ABC transport system permease protein
MSWRRFFRRRQRDAESAWDIQFYLDTETEDNIARGMPPEEARAAALRQFGNPALIREEIYHMNSIAHFETAWQDLLYALRTTRGNPGFVMTAVLTVALGIAGNTAMFTVIRAVLLKPLEYRDPDRLVRVSADYPRLNAQDTTFSLRRFLDMRAAGRSFSGFGAYLLSPENVTLSGGGQPEALKEARVSANFLEILGMQPLLGRSFLAKEDARGGPPVTMISAELWKRRFGSDPQVAGKGATLNSTPHTIIGVLPAGFAFPFPGADVWVTRPSEWSWLHPRNWDGVTDLIGFARLKPDVSLEQARAEMSVLTQQYALSHPAEANAKVRVGWLKDYMVANVRPMLWMLFGAVGFVLMIACANVASLLLARATSRSREFAVRAALGASRGRLIRQLLAESLLLVAAGGALGVLLAQWGLSAITRGIALNGADWSGMQLLPRAAEIRLDGMVLGFTAALSMATGILVGLFPSLRASRPDLADVLRGSGTGTVRPSSGTRGLLGVSARGLLVVGQVAFSIVLVIGAALLIESFARLRGVDPGFQPVNLLTMKISLPPARYDSEQKKAAFFGELVQRVETVAGVREATVVMSLPTTAIMQTNVKVEGQPPVDPREQPSAQIQSITPGYFHTLGIPLRRGREFVARDNARDAPPVVVINESFARRFWPDYPRGRNPVGQHMGEGADKLDAAEIVGIVADIHERSLAANARPEFYVPCVVHPSQMASLVVRTDGDPRRFVNSIRSQVSAIDPDQSVSDIKTMDELIDGSVGKPRLTTVLLGLFAGVALLLAVVGIYGVIAYSVAQRTQELAIRQALGAERRDVLRLVLGQALGLALPGVALGIGGAFALTRVMEGLLFHVSATNPTTYVGVAALFVSVALAASYLPARRATRVDPAAALRFG